MERSQFVVGSSELRQIVVATEVITQIVGHAAAESCVVVALAGRGCLSPLARWEAR